MYLNKQHFAGTFTFRFLNLIFFVSFFNHIFIATLQAHQLRAKGINIFTDQLHAVEAQPFSAATERTTAGLMTKANTKVRSPKVGSPKPMFCTLKCGYTLQSAYFEGNVV